jgi:hypothetical protein
LACETLATLSPDSIITEGLVSDLGSDDPQRLKSAMDLMRRMAYTNVPLSPVVQRVCGFLRPGDLALQAEAAGLLADLAYAPANRDVALDALADASIGPGLLGRLAASTLDRLKADSAPRPSTTSLAVQALRASAENATVRAMRSEGVSGGVLVPAADAHVVAVQTASRVVSDSLDGAYDRRRQARLLDSLYQTRAFAARPGLVEALVRSDGLTVVCHGSAIEALGIATELAALAARLPGYSLKLGLSTGPVMLRRDVHGQIVVAGEGVSTAHIVAKHGDAGHVLASEYLVKRLTDDERRRFDLVDLGQRKYTDFMHVYNVSDLLGAYGRAEVPDGLVDYRRKLTRGQSARRRRRSVAVVIAAVVVLAGATYGRWRPVACERFGERLLASLHLADRRYDPCSGTAGPSRQPKPARLRHGR